jgi:hypothetical protein
MDQNAALFVAMFIKGKLFNMLTANTTSDRFQRGEHRPFSEVSVAQ